MARYRKKPVEIEAVRFTGSNQAEVSDFMGASPEFGSNSDGDSWVVLITIDGERVPCPAGHWVIAEPVPNRFYPCDPGVFADRYEEVRD